MVARKMKLTNDIKVNAIESPEFSYGQIFAILLHHRLLFIGVLSIVVAYFLASTLRKPSTYMSSMQLLIEPNYPSSLDNLIETTGSSTQSQQDYATQLNLMRSDLFIDRLIKNLTSKYPNTSSNEIQSSLTIEKVFEGKDPTKIIKVTFVGNSSEKTKTVLTYLQELYQNYNRNQQTLKLTEGLRFIDGQLEVSRKSISNIQNRIENYRKRNSIFDPLQQVTVVNNALNQVEQDIRIVQTQRKETEARYNALEQRLNISPKNRLNILRLSQSEFYQKQIASIKETEQELARQRSIVTDNNPIIKNLTERRQKQINLLKNGAEQILGSSISGITNSSNTLLQSGQLSAVDINVVTNLNELRAELVSLNTRERKLLTSKQQLRTQLNQFPSLIAEYQRLQPEVELGQSVLKKLLEQRQEISSRLSRGGFTWQVVEPPLEGNKIGPDHKKDILLGIVVGIFLASGAVFLLEMLNKHNFLHQDIKLDPPLSIVPILGYLPEITLTTSLNHPLHEEYSNELVFLQRLDSPELRNAVDLIYRNIQLYNSENLIKSIIITSPFSGEGKTTLTLALALRMARSNLRVLIVDTDFGHSNFLDFAEIKDSQKLSDLLVNKILEPAPEELSLFDSKFDIISPGILSKESSQYRFLGSKRMKQLVKTFSSNYDLVLLDTSSIPNISYVSQLSKFCDASILISRLDKLGQSQLNNSIINIKKSNILGLVDNKLSQSSLIFNEKNKNCLNKNQSIIVPYFVSHHG
jgi:polysaccharide biosynthesis transport protein